ncbi:MAG: (Fe-S)-binding protein [Chloroflexota bacterium]
MMLQNNGQPPKRVRLFVTCLVDHLSPEVGEAVVTVLERLGLAVDAPAGQTCCGQPAFNGGFWAEARQMARHTIKILGQEDTPIIVPSGSCADMIIHHYPELFAGEPEWQARAQRVAANTYEFTQFLVDVLGVTDVGACFNGKLTYHASCHLLRGLGVNHQPQTLLENVRGAELVPLERADECCGFGGLFSVKFPLISEDMLANKLNYITTAQADRVVGCDLSCLMHINAGLHRRGQATHAVHIAQILARQGSRVAG